MALGALLATALPYLGSAAAGAAGAGLANALSSGGLGSTPGREKQFQRFTPQQQQFQNTALQQALGYLQSGGGSFEPIEQRARQQFQTQTIPGLAERFTAMGGGQRSSAFQGALGQAGANLESDLAAQRQLFGQQQFGNLSNIGLQPSFESTYFPRQPGFGETAGTEILKILPLLLQLLSKGA